jgi:release factor glutamine methyltransferase
MLSKKELKIAFDNATHLLYEKNEAETIFFILLKEFGISKISWLLENEFEIDENKFYTCINQLKKNIPIQYILCYEYFCGMKLNVTNAVLIPRPETEELVNLISNEYKNEKEKTILDIGTGSGCIALGLKKFLPNFNVFAIEKSEAAINLAKENAKKENLAITFFQEDILNLSADIKELKIDIIVSNPPYILKKEKSEMEKRVYEHEPEMALFVDDNDGLLFYKKIILLSNEMLLPDGKIFFEINQAYGNELKNWSEENGFDCEIKKDMFENNRFAILKKNNLRKKIELF